MKNLKSPYDNINNLWFECSKRGLQSEPLIQTALEQLRINPFDLKCLNLVQNRIQSYDVRETLHPEPFRHTNPKYNIPGSIKLGGIKHTNTTYSINPSDLIVHLIVAGRTGGGKTSIIKLIIRQLMKRRKE